MLYAVVVQFVGVSFVVALVPMVMVPFFEARFETRLARILPKLDDFVFIYRHGEAVEALYEELKSAQLPVVVFEEDESTARRLRDRGLHVVLGRLEEEEPDLAPLATARAVIVNGEDDDNAMMVLSARAQGYTGKIFAFVHSEHHRQPMILAGADQAHMPYHVLARALAARASNAISHRVEGLPLLGGALSVAEMRVHEDCEFAGKSLSEARIRARTGTTVIGISGPTGYSYQPQPSDRLEAGSLIIAVGSDANVERLSHLATPLDREGPCLLLGYGVVGRKAAQLLREAGEELRIVDRKASEDVDVVGDALDPKVLVAAGIHHAKVLILALDRNSPTLLAAAAVRSLAPDLPVIARVNRNHDAARIHRAGVDFALSTGQVSSMLIARDILGQESMGLDPAFKIAMIPGDDWAGMRTSALSELQHCGCSVVAVECCNGEGRVEVDITPEMEVHEGDHLYIGGPPKAVDELTKAHPAKMAPSRNEAKPG